RFLPPGRVDCGSKLPLGSWSRPPCRLGSGARAQTLLRDRLELVTHAVTRLDECVPRGAAVDLLAQAADAHVDGAVAVGRAPAPDSLQQLVPTRDPAHVEGERVEEPELGRRQARVFPAHE